MTVTVEDGTGVAGANSYISLADAKTYAKDRGITLVDDDVKLEQYMNKAVDYLESLRSDYKGAKAVSTNALQWPRTGVTIDRVVIASTTIPNELKYAQVELMIAINGGTDIVPTATGDAFVTREKIGPIDTQYSEGVSTSGIPIVRKAEMYLAPLLRHGSTLATVRA